MICFSVFQDVDSGLLTRFQKSIVDFLFSILTSNLASSGADGADATAASDPTSDASQQALGLLSVCMDHKAVNDRIVAVGVPVLWRMLLEGSPALQRSAVGCLRRLLTGRAPDSPDLPSNFAHTLLSHLGRLLCVQTVFVPGETEEFNVPFKSSAVSLLLAAEVCMLIRGLLTRSAAWRFVVIQWYSFFVTAV